jgi:hypothetical protein
MIMKLVTRSKTAIIANCHGEYDGGCGNDDDDGSEDAERCDGNGARLLYRDATSSLNKTFNYACRFDSCALFS